MVISTVGPYQLHGEPLITACARAGTDYVDLCGEPLWMSSVNKTGEPPLRPIHLFDPPQRIEVMAEVPDGPPHRFRWQADLLQ